MPDQSANLSLPYLQPAQAQKHVTHNEALLRLDTLVQTVVVDRDLAAPPALPDEGACYIVAAGGSGAWAGQDGALATWRDGGWMFLAPRPGWSAEVLDEARRVTWDGSGWSPAPGGFDRCDGLGIATDADAGNRLAVASPAVLFTHAGDDHRLKLNKAAAADTASLLFQTGWSGRAEFGLAGTDDFSVKVSADGSGWATALSVPAATGIPALAAGATIGGEAAYHRGNLLGGVAETGGVPTGAVIEAGSNANGAWTRWADGTQIVRQSSLDLVYFSGTVCTSDWTFPAAFASSNAPIVLANINAGGSSIAPGLDQIGAPVWSNSGANSTTARLQVRRISGMTGFASGNFVRVMVAAIGRWF